MAQIPVDGSERLEVSRNNLTVTFAAPDDSGPNYLGEWQRAIKDQVKVAQDQDDARAKEVEARAMADVDRAKAQAVAEAADADRVKAQAVAEAAKKEAEKAKAERAAAEERVREEKDWPTRINMLRIATPWRGQKKRLTTDLPMTSYIK